MSSNKNARLALESIYGKGSMFKKAECERQIEKQKLKIKGYKRFLQEKRYSGKILKTKSRQMTYHHLQHRSEGGKTDVENGAILSTLEHEYIHSLSREQEEVINNMIRQYKYSIDVNCGIMTPTKSGIELENTNSIEFDIDNEEDLLVIPAYDMTDRDREIYNRAKEKRELQKYIDEYLYEENSEDEDRQKS